MGVSRALMRRDVGVAHRMGTDNAGGPPRFTLTPGRRAAFDSRQGLR